jgi:hypothetical protein
MELEPDFRFRPIPPIEHADQLFFAKAAATSPLGDLEPLIGKWSGPRFNTIWRPNFSPEQGHFLELNATSEIIEFTEIPGPIPNRGLLQADIEMFGLTYLQQIKDASNNAGLHIEPGIWATVPLTTDPREDPTMVRMASILHGTTMIAQGAAIAALNGPPRIVPVDITPFKIGSPKQTIKFPETDLSIPTAFRSPQILGGITQAMVDDPNSVLVAALAGQTITRTAILDVSSSTSVVGGGTSNTAFLQGATGGPNAVASVVTSTFWIETVDDGAGGSFLQLQYTQTVLLDFAGLSWPHVTVATLRKVTA